MSSDGRIEFTLDDGHTVNVRIGGGHITEPKTHSTCQPRCCRELVDVGWRFTWEPATKFVACEHPLGGKQSFIRVEHVGRKGFETNEIGEAIAKLLNGDCNE